MAVVIVVVVVVAMSRGEVSRGSSECGEGSNRETVHCRRLRGILGC